MIARIPAYNETLPEAPQFKHSRDISEFEDHEEWRKSFNVEYDAWLIDNGIGREAIVGKVGNGAKVHRLIARTQIINGEVIVRSIASCCGSQKWSLRGTSRLMAFADDHPITCKKCEKQGIN
tara:strand:+ start:179 stop:544 length:366 start_codon:yes stop_codon:yes gene_type:complete